MATIRTTLPDVVLMDVDMPGQSCFDAARAIQAIKPDVRIIFLSGFHHDHYIERALEVRAAGYVTKGEPAEAVVQAIRGAVGRAFVLIRGVRSHRRARRGDPPGRQDAYAGGDADGP